MRIWTTKTLTRAVRGQVLTMRQELERPLPLQDQLLVEDLCQALGLDPLEILGQRPSEEVIPCPI